MKETMGDVRLVPRGYAQLSAGSPQNPPQWPPAPTYLLAITDGYGRLSRRTSATFRIGGRHAPFFLGLFPGFWDKPDRPGDYGV